MSITLAKVRKLLTQREIEFATSVSPKSLTGLSAAQLRSKQKQAARLKDKYTSLARQQRREARGKAAPRGKRASQSNDNTKAKSEFFAGLEARIAQRLEKVEKKLQNARSGSGAKRRKTSAGAAGGASTRKRSKGGGGRAGARSKKTGRAGTRARKPATDETGFDASHSVRRPASAVRGAGGAPAPAATGSGAQLPPRLGGEAEARKTRREMVDRESLPARIENIEAQRPDRRIEGHVRSTVRRRQAARDSGGKG